MVSNKQSNYTTTAVVLKPLFATIALEVTLRRLISSRSFTSQYKMWVWGTCYPILALVCAKRQHNWQTPCSKFDKWRKKNWKRAYRWLIIVRALNCTSDQKWRKKNNRHIYFVGCPVRNWEQENERRKEGDRHEEWERGHCCPEGQSDHTRHQGTESRFCELVFKL